MNTSTPLIGAIHRHRVVAAHHGNFVGEALREISLFPNYRTGDLFSHERTSISREVLGEVTATICLRLPLKAASSQTRKGPPAVGSVRAMRLSFTTRSGVDSRILVGELCDDRSKEILGLMRSGRVNEFTGSTPTSISEILKVINSHKLPALGYGVTHPDALLSLIAPTLDLIAFHERTVAKIPIARSTRPTPALIIDGWPHRWSEREQDLNNSPQNRVFGRVSVAEGPMIATFSIGELLSGGQASQVVPLSSRALFLGISDLPVVRYADSAVITFLDSGGEKVESVRLDGLTPEALDDLGTVLFRLSPHGIASLARKPHLGKTPDSSGVFELFLKLIGDHGVELRTSQSTTAELKQNLGPFFHAVDQSAKRVRARIADEDRHVEVRTPRMAQSDVVRKVIKQEGNTALSPQSTKPGARSQNLTLTNTRKAQKDAAALAKRPVKDGLLAIRKLGQGDDDLSLQTLMEIMNLSTEGEKWRYREAAAAAIGSRKLDGEIGDIALDFLMKRGESRDYGRVVKSSIMALTKHIRRRGVKDFLIALITHPSREDSDRLKDTKILGAIEALEPHRSDPEILAVLTKAPTKESLHPERGSRYDSSGETVILPQGNLPGRTGMNLGEVLRKAQLDGNRRRK